MGANRKPLWSLPQCCSSPLCRASLSRLLRWNLGSGPWLLWSISGTESSPFTLSYKQSLFLGRPWWCSQLSLRLWFWLRSWCQGHRSSPVLGSVQSMEPAWDSLSLPPPAPRLCPSPAHFHKMSQSKLGNSCLNLSLSRSYQADHCRQWLKSCGHFWGLPGTALSFWRGGSKAETGPRW